MYLGNGAGEAFLGHHKIHAVELESCGRTRMAALARCNTALIIGHM